MTDIFRSRPDHSRAPARRVGVLATVGIGALLFLAPTASAAGDAALTGGDSPTAADRNAARQALVSPEATNRLATFFVHLDQRATAQNGAVVQSKVAPEAAAAQAPQLVGAAVPVYSLNADFVRGGDSSAPVANFAYLATEARSAAGVEATVWTVRDRASGAWRVTNVLSGADEVGYARQAGDDTVFTEPQIAAWYRVHAGRVLPLNPAALQSVGPDGATLADYRGLVHGRYADKLPGSTYRRDGKLGGFAATPSTRHGGFSAADIALPASAAGVLVLGAGTLVIRRRRSATA
ncbi:hypothetical protein ACFRCG_23115 [Embleya sp. NPDC056575]|uniref:hypothetical protein n=1 Tax=unclassified Embleya TaxID=2699296 RepID=UPI00368066DF